MSDSPESIAILLGRLRDSVEHLAWPPSRQKEYLVELGVAPLADELALEFDDAIRPLSPLLDEVALSVSTRQALRELDAVLARMSSNEPRSREHWQLEALDERDSWMEVQKLANKALTGLLELLS